MPKRVAGSRKVHAQKFENAIHRWPLLCSTFAIRNSSVFSIQTVSLHTTVFQCCISVRSYLTCAGHMYIQCMAYCRPPSKVEYVRSIAMAMSMSHQNDRQVEAMPPIQRNWERPVGLPRVTDGCAGHRRPFLRSRGFSNRVILDELSINGRLAKEWMVLS